MSRTRSYNYRDRFMILLHLPHQEPVKFAQYVLSKTESEALVHVKFPSIPSLGMIVEAAAQSSSAFAQEDTKLGFLAAVKNVKLIEKPLTNQYTIRIEKKYVMDLMHYFDFKVLYKNNFIASGSYIIAIS